MVTPGTADNTSKNDTENGADPANRQTLDTSYHSTAAGRRGDTTRAKIDPGSGTGNDNDDTAATDADTPATGGHNAKAPWETGLTNTPDADEASERKGGTPAAVAMAKFCGGGNMPRDNVDIATDTTVITEAPTATIPAPLQLLIQAAVSSWEIRIGIPKAAPKGKENKKRKQKRKRRKRRKRKRQKTKDEEGEEDKMTKEEERGRTRREEQRRRRTRRERKRD